MDGKWRDEEDDGTPKVKKKNSNRNQEQDIPTASKIESFRKEERQSSGNSRSGQSFADSKDKKIFRKDRLW